MDVLHMTLKKPFFDEVLTGSLRTDHRKTSRYWASRLIGKNYDAILYRNGYRKNSPEILIGYDGYDVLENIDSYRVHSGKILATKNLAMS